ncbi:uncharacterized protein FIBRA_06999 [Fibroporia radiculosa]|uniref:ABC transporter domain-containing protein n=1 Tax=Fibroporia radiculosa TaxID=599839 RepID=J4IBK2_9APHY|nr:uncharacterized protein FIBRA_06999 [Fibroporia radiculosa]CCM04806.1 predicted protein [Fibroporia radiculosa]
MTLRTRVRVFLSHIVSPVPEFSPSPSHGSHSHDSLRFPSRQAVNSAQAHPHGAIYKAWLASRTIPNDTGAYLTPGAHRSLSKSNVRLACTIMQSCAVDLFRLLWSLHPWRTALMVTLELIRGIFPAFRGYSQALLINELQNLIFSGHFTWSRLSKLVATEIVRAGSESLIDSIASSNENIVHGSARLRVEYQQMELRLRLDIPTLADPLVRDLLHEADLFARSFSGMSSFGLFSTLDFMRILTLVSELISHVLVLSSLAFNGAHISVLLISILSSVLPFILRSSNGRSFLDDLAKPYEAHMAAKQERMRILAHSDSYRPEVILFGLGPWILRSWARARKAMLGLEGCHSSEESDVYSRLMSHVNVSGLLMMIQNIPLVLILQSPSASFGTFTLYQSSVQALFFTIGHLSQSIRMAYQGIFLMGAFSAAMSIQPRLQPKKEVATVYQSFTKGMRLEARNLSYTYPGCITSALQGIDLNIEAGEVVAINRQERPWEGKSTLAKILLRILDFDSGELLINGIDVQRLRPEDYHAHITAVFQDFSKFNASAQENIGVGCIKEMRNMAAIESAIRLAGAKNIVHSLPQGLKTKLDAASHEAANTAFAEAPSCMASTYPHHGLSGGEWQRIAVSRAFMRARRPEIDLILLDEPTSSLDAHAQNRIFDNVEKASRSPDGDRTKTVIFITHRLSTARRADKIVMMDSGTISEFGTHQELLRRNGQYAALYRASI